MAKIGRPRKYQNDEDRMAAIRSAVKANRASIAVDRDLLNELKAISDSLEAQLGFRPSMSQALRHLLMKVGWKGKDETK